MSSTGHGFESDRISALRSWASYSIASRIMLEVRVLGPSSWRTLKTSARIQWTSAPLIYTMQEQLRPVHYQQRKKWLQCCNRGGDVSLKTRENCSINNNLKDPFAYRIVTFFLNSHNDIEGTMVNLLTLNSSFQLRFFVLLMFEHSEFST